MWLSEQISRRDEGNKSKISRGVLTIDGENPAVMLEGERRELPVLWPGGVAWAPAVGDEVIVLCEENGEYFILGIPAGAETPKAGETVLGKGKVKLRICSDAIHVEGDLKIEGRLILNGRDIGAMLETL